MKFLVLGTGGIGGRHAKRLRHIAPGAEFIGVRSGPSSVTSELSMALYPSLAAALDERPDAAVIALPPVLHAGAAKTCLLAGVPVYLEKPVAIRSEDLAGAAGSALTENIVTMVGCVLRSMSGFRKLRAALREGRIGRVLHAQLSVSEWLPARPGRDYRQLYAARRELGGGVMLDLIHEIDLARFLFGEFQSAWSMSGRSGVLDVNVEDSADFILRNDATTVTIHMDYLDRAGLRRGRIIGSDGVLEYDAIAGAARHYDPADASWHEIAGAADFPESAAHELALAHFVECVRARRQTDQPLTEGVASLRLLELARANALGSMP